MKYFTIHCIPLLRMLARILPASSVRQASMGNPLGFAIPIVLFFLVMVTLMTVFLLQLSRINQQSTQSYANSLRAEQLGQGALAFISLDLVREIQSSKMSTLVTPPSTATAANKFNIYRPNRTWDMVPKAWSTNNDPFSAGATTSLTPAEKLLLDGIVRTSSFESFPKDEYASAQTPNPGKYPFPLAIPSAPSTYAASVDGRALSFDFWNKIFFLKNDQPTKSAFSKIQPGWVIVTRQGPKLFTSWDPNLAQKTSNDYAIGRFAYVIYDVGGRLDANWAGFPKSGNGKPSDVDIARKGHVALADLEEVGLTQAQILNFFNWRTSNQITNSAQADEWVKSLFGEHELPSGLPDTNKPNWAAQGYMQIPSGFNAFLGRQDFLKFANKAGFLNNSQNSARFFTLYSREKNSPTYFPTYNAPAGLTKSDFFQYRTNALPNPNSATERLWMPGYTSAGFNPQSASVRNDVNTHMGTARANNGQSLIQQRFPLSRLALLTPTATSAPGSDIHRYFGLVRATANEPWQYVSPDASTIHPTTAIRVKTLLEISRLTYSNIFPVTVRGKPREPDFFELIHACNLRGSAYWDNRRPPYKWMDQNGTSLTTRRRNEGLPALRIGLSIIDQLDSDSYPTTIRARIVTNDTEGANGQGTLTEFSGTEDLPYMSEFLTKFVRPSSTSKSYGNFGTFELWNPHQNSKMALNLPDYPTKFRVRILDGLSRSTIEDFGESASGSRPAYAGVQRTTEEVDFLEDYDPATGETRNNISFAPELNNNFFTDPQILMKNNIIENGNKDSAEQMPSPYTGFYMGSQTDAVEEAEDRRLAGSSPIARTWERTWWLGNGFLFDLQYFNGSSWITYQTFWDNRGYKGTASYNRGNPGEGISSPTISGTTTTAVPSFTKNDWWTTSMVRMDPRGYVWGMNGPSMTLNQSMRPSAANGPNVGFSVIGENNDSPVLDQGLDAHAATTSQGVIYYGSGSGGPAGAMTDNLRRLIGGTSFDASKSSPLFAFSSDGIVRRADGNSFEDVLPAAASNLPKTNGKSRMEDRPIVLNRSARSVGEMGYTFREQIFKTVDFNSKDSADAGLLDAFGVAEGNTIAGKINLNSAPKEVLASVLSGAGRSGMDLATSAPLNTISSADAGLIANDIFQTVRAGLSVADTNLLAEQGPFWNRSELVTRLGQIRENTFNTTYPAVKSQREAVTRALAEVGETRTWNLVIDVVAQAGRYPISTINADPKALEHFQVDAERRFWLHISIDRLTGEILSQHVETVYE